MTLSRQRQQGDPWPCKRRRYADYAAAEVALAIIKRGWHNHYAMELRIVQCKTCGGWHLVKR